jgi:hypothetical protein
MGANAKGLAGRFVYIGVPQVNSGTGMLNVVNNVVRGAGGDRDTGLSYQIGKGEGLMVVSANNNVMSVASGRVVGDKVTLVNPL